MLAWAGVSDIDPASRGGNVDGRHLAFVEAIRIDEFQQLHGPTDTYLTDPNAEAGAMIEEYYESMMEAFMLRFMAQAPQASVLMGVLLPDYDEVTEVLPLSFLHSLTLDYTTGNPVLSGDLELVVDGMFEAISARRITAENVAFILDMLRHDLGADDQSYYDDLSSYLSFHSDWSSAFAVGQLIADGTLIINTLGDDNLEGGEESNNYKYSLGQGSDTITDFDYSGNTGTDTLTFTDVNAADVGLSRSGNDLVITLANGETVTVVNHLDEDYDYSMESIVFADGVTLGYQDIRDRLISEMKATGVVTGTSRTENYEHTLGDGSYTITDIDPYGYTGTDTFVFTDVNSTDVTVQRLSSDPNDVVISLANGDQITLSDELVSNNDYGVESISFADGVTWDRNDLLTAPIVDDAFVFV